ncbi:hypothetical protein [Halonotius sp. GCM10025705]|uniref:hypothetical protein n=1 Tax=Halonotius sp. GCM10025705 TaxID=3252678 RepID=UPI00360666FB
MAGQCHHYSLSNHYSVFYFSFPNTVQFSFFIDSTISHKQIYERYGNNINRPLLEATERLTGCIFDPVYSNRFYAQILRHQSKSGGYIQTSIEGQPQVLQVAPSAEVLLSELGYEYDEYVPRDVTKPLIIPGVLETKPHGHSKRELLDGIPKLAVEYCELDSDQQSKLQTFLRDRVADLTSADYELLSEFLESESPLEQVPHQLELSQKESEIAQPESSPSTPKEDINLNCIPSELRNDDQWICWRTEMRNGKPTKVPVSPNKKDFARFDDASTWTSFEIAVKNVNVGGQGIREHPKNAASLLPKRRSLLLCYSLCPVVIGSLRTRCTVRPVQPVF